MMGCCASFVYIFAAMTPFIAINLFGMSSAEYGMANILPSIGLTLGSLVGARLVKKHSQLALIHGGILIACVGAALMGIAMLLEVPLLYSLFVTMILIYFGLCFVMANASSFAMSRVHDKAHGSAVMSFVNMGVPTVAVLSIGFLPIKTLMLPAIYLCLCLIMLGIFKLVYQETEKKGK